MNSISKFLEKKLLPIATLVANNTYIQVLSQTFISLIPIIIIGAFSLILSKAPIDYSGFEEGTYWYNFFLGWSNWTDQSLWPLKFINAATLGSLSLWVSVGIAYRWAKKHDMDLMSTIIVVFVNFILINSNMIEGGWSTAYFGGEGLFSAIIGSFLIVQLYRYLTKKEFGRINLPESVPPALAKSMNSMIPMTICFLSGAIVTGVSHALFGVSIPELIMTIGKPINNGVDNPFVPSLIYMGSNVGYWFGIHTAAIEAPFDPIMFGNLAVNADAFAKGTAASDLPYIVNIALRYGFTGIGGSGATFGLVLLLIRSKSESIRSVGKLSLIPACFGINEPVVFGLPIMMNVTFLIPFLIVESVNTFIAYLAMYFNLLNRPIFFMGGTAPELLKSVLSNMDVRSVIYWFIAVAVDIMIWYPFFKIFEKQKLEEEQQGKPAVSS